MGPGGQRKLHAPLPPSAAHKLLVTPKIKQILSIITDFKSLFTRENLSTLPTISDTSSYIPDMPNLTISHCGIQNLLSTLDHAKS